MSDVFTNYVRSFGSGEEDVSEIWCNLEFALRTRLKRRRLLSQPPRFLGYNDFTSWRDPEAFRELVTDCFIQALLKRIDQLKAMIDLGHAVEGAVYANIEHFLTDCQRRGNPVGYRLYHVLLEALKECEQRGILSVVPEGGVRIDARSIAAFAGSPGTEPALRDQLLFAIQADEQWTQVTEQLTRGSREVRESLCDAISRLGRSGISSFKVNDLLAAARRLISKRISSRAFDPERATVREMNREGEIELIRTTEPNERYVDEEDDAEVRSLRIRQAIDVLDRRPQVKAKLLLVLDELERRRDSHEPFDSAELYTRLGLSKSSFHEYLSLLRTLGRDLDNRNASDP